MTIKLPLRYFILACLLLGAIGVPCAWRMYQARRAEIERLEDELAELEGRFTKSFNSWDRYLSGEETLEQTEARLAAHLRRIRVIVRRRTELTGDKYDPTAKLKNIIEMERELNRIGTILCPMDNTPIPPMTAKQHSTMLARASKLSKRLVELRSK